MDFAALCVMVVPPTLTELRMLKVTGLDEVRRKLDQLAKGLRAVDGQQVPLNDLLTAAFLTKHTPFSSADEMFEAGGLKVESQEDFAAIPEDALDAFVRSISNFDSWSAMLGAAGSAWAATRLGLK